MELFLPNGLNGLQIGVTNHLLTGMILQVVHLSHGFFVFIVPDKVAREVYLRLRRPESEMG